MFKLQLPYIENIAVGELEVLIAVCNITVFAVELSHSILIM